MRTFFIPGVHVVDKPEASASGSPGPGGSLPPRPGLVPRRVVTYQHPDGNDGTADGTRERPFKTFVAAIDSWPIDAEGDTYVLDRTGCTDHLPPAYALRPFRDSVRPQLRFPTVPHYAHFWAESSFNILADSTTLAVIPEMVQGSATIDPRSKLVTVRVPGVAWAPGQWRGRQLISADGYISGIVASGADWLKLGIRVAPALPWRIVEPGAALIGGLDPERFRGAINLDNVQTSLLIGGHLIKSTDPSAGFALVAARCLALRLSGCQFDGDLGLFDIPSAVGFDACWFRRGDIGRGLIDCQRSSLGIGSSYVERFRTTATFDDASICELFQTVWEGADAPLGPKLKRLRMFMSEILGSTGAIAPGGVATQLPTLEIESLGLTSCDVTLENVRIDGCAGDAVSIGLRGGALLQNVGGSGNTGVGVRVHDGAQVEVDATTEVTGTAGDLKIGSRPLRTWADFRAQDPIRNEADFLNPKTSDGSRLFQRATDGGTEP